MGFICISGLHFPNNWLSKLNIISWDRQLCVFGIVSHLCVFGERFIQVLGIHDPWPWPMTWFFFVFICFNATTTKDLCYFLPSCGWLLTMLMVFLTLMFLISNFCSHLFSYCSCFGCYIHAVTAKTMWRWWQWYHPDFCWWFCRFF